MNKHDVIVKSIESLKAGGFKATALKVELEAQFNRRNRNTSCGDCGGDGYRYCDECEENFGSEIVCHDYLLEKLEPLGLAKRGGGARSDRFVEDGALKYSKFYNDQSVDSEWTFTISLEDPETVFHLPKMVEAFKQLGEAINGSFDVTGAGMHIALLDDENCVYDPNTYRGDSIAKEHRFHNFRRSMNLLMPALFFLGSSNENSRGLRYRQPQVNLNTHQGTKYWAVNYGYGALEFRLFETCYHSPEMILDDIVVIANCMKFWGDQYIPSGLAKIVDKCQFGVDNNNSLERFYVKAEHLDLLNEGLKKIKPSYLTITELKAQRKFKKTKREINNREREARKEAKKLYKSYVKRHDWSKKIRFSREYYYRMENLQTRAEQGEDVAVLEAEAEKHAEQHAKALDADKKTLEMFVDEHVNTKLNVNAGNFQLAEN